jgi:uncharacterized protein with HEPN domain
MSLSPLEYLRHIRDEADYLVAKAKGLTREEFFLDETIKRAFVRSLEIIGEAAKKVPLELQHKYVQAEWRSMAAMRDRLIHGYFGVDYDIVWDVVVNKVPVTRQQMESILQQEYGEE